MSLSPLTGLSSPSVPSSILLLCQTYVLILYVDLFWGAFNNNPGNKSKIKCKLDALSAVVAFVINNSELAGRLQKSRFSFFLFFPLNLEKQGHMLVA